MTKGDYILVGKVHWEKTRNEYRLSEVVQPLDEIPDRYFMPNNLRLQLIGIDWLKRNKKSFRNETIPKSVLKLMSRKRLRHQKDLKATMARLIKKYGLPERAFNCVNCTDHVHAVEAGNTGIFAGRHVLEPDEPTPTLTTGNTLGFIQEGKWRFATEVERERLMGMNDHWTLDKKNTNHQRIKQTGNAVVVPVIWFIANRICDNLYTQDRSVPVVFDAFSGVGGFHLGLDEMGMFDFGGKAEIDKYASSLYTKRFGGYSGHGDIKKVIKARQEPFDVFCGGFPCQAFSSIGKRLGFLDQTKGTLFFEIARMAKEFGPKVLFLENVEGLLTHDNGRTFRTVVCTLKELGYEVEWQLINARYLVPQDRERVYIVAHKSNLNWRPVFPVSQSELEKSRIIVDWRAGRLMPPDVSNPPKT
jgi:site-specific DNA-cytosine methylase